MLWFAIGLVEKKVILAVISASYSVKLVLDVSYYDLRTRVLIIVDPSAPSSSYLTTNIKSINKPIKNDTHKPHMVGWPGSSMA